MFKFIIFSYFFFLVSCSVFVETVTEPSRLKKIPAGVKVDDPIFFLFIAKNLYNKKDYSRSVYYYNKAKKRIIELNLQKENGKDYIWIVYEMGFCFYKMDEYAQAYKYFQEVVENKVSFSARNLAVEMLEKISKKQKKI